jgi:antitoxin component of RelBE/YafQ-DinJ toxin-antitoxin module
MAANIKIDGDTWITQQALADKLGCTIQKVHNWVQRGNIQTKHIPEFNITLVNESTLSVRKYQRIN